MSTTYTGNASSTQAPSGPPVDGNPPELTLPADGDPANAASVAQAYKVVADFIAFLLRPFAKAAAWAQRIWSVTNARSHSRWGLDHLGYPAGNVDITREYWRDVGFATKNSIGNGAWYGNWFYSISGAAAGTITSQAASSGGSGGTDGGISLTCPGSGVTVSTEHTEQALAIEIGNDFDTVISWEANHTDHNSAEFTMGLYDSVSSLLGVATSFNTVQPIGVAFERRHADANWQAYHKDSGGSPVFTDSGVAFTGSTTRFRIEIRGVNESDDSTARVIVYINGAVVANITTDLALTPTGALTLFFRITDVGATSNMQINALTITRNRWAGDVFL